MKLIITIIVVAVIGFIVGFLFMNGTKTNIKEDIQSGDIINVEPIYNDVSGDDFGEIVVDISGETLNDNSGESGELEESTISKEDKIKLIDAKVLSIINSNDEVNRVVDKLSLDLVNDLAKSLYQLNVFYSTATQLAGALDKSKLIDIMTDSLEQSLSLSLCYAFILNEVNDIQLIIKSLYPISTRLENAIKLSASAR